MGLFDKIKNLVSGAQGKLPENMNSVDEVKAKAQELSEQHGETVNRTVDGIQEKLPGQTGDRAIDNVQQRFNDFTNKK